MNEQQKLNPYESPTNYNRTLYPDQTPTADEIRESLDEAKNQINIALRDPELADFIKTFDNSRLKAHNATDHEAILEEFIRTNNPSLGQLGKDSLALVVAANKFGSTFTSDKDLNVIIEGLENQRELDRKRRELQRATTQYNTEIRNYLFQYPDTSIKDIINLFTEAWINYNPDITRDSAVNKITALVRGALHEVLFEYVVSDLCKSDSRFTFRRATNEEDSMGVDFYVYIDGIEFLIDIKSSKNQFNNKNTGSKIERQKNGKFLLCLFSKKDESKAKLDPETQRAYVGELKEILEKIVEKTNLNKNDLDLAA